MPDPSWTLACLAWSAAGFLAGFAVITGSVRRRLARRRR